MHLAPDKDFLPLTHDKPARAVTPCSVPKAACPQNRLQLPLVQSPPLAHCCSLVRLHGAPAAVQRLSSHHHQAWWPWGFPMVKRQYGDTHECAECSVPLHNWDYKSCVEGEGKTAFAFRHSLPLWFLCSFLSIISLSFFLSTANLL